MDRDRELCAPLQKLFGSHLSLRTVPPVLGGCSSPHFREMLDPILRLLRHEAELISPLPNYYLHLQDTLSQVARKLLVICK